MRVQIGDANAVLRLEEFETRRAENQYADGAPGAAQFREVGWLRAGRRCPDDRYAEPQRELGGDVAEGIVARVADPAYDAGQRRQRLAARIVMKDGNGIRP